MFQLCGESLRDLLNERLGPVEVKLFRESEILEFFSMVTLAVEYLHSRSPPVTHRDIKPDVSVKKGFIIFRPYFIWERKIFKSNGFFFLQNLPRFYLYLNLRVLPIEFNPHKFSFVRYVFVEIFEVFF